MTKYIVTKDTRAVVFGTREAVYLTAGSEVALKADLVNSLQVTSLEDNHADLNGATIILPKDTAVPARPGY